MNIEDYKKWLEYYFPNIKDQDLSNWLEILENSTTKPVDWGRSHGSDYLKHSLSLYATAIALMEGKSVLVAGSIKFGSKVVEDLKARFNIEATTERQKMGLLLKLKCYENPYI